MNANTETFLDCLAKARVETQPYRHWLLSGILTEEACEEIRNLPIEAPEISDYVGTRESNNDSRGYFNKEACARFGVCARLAETFNEPQVVAAIEDACGIDLSRGHPRIEYTQDRDGFWLEPHKDISVKLFTMLIYLSTEPELADAGTDIFDRNLAQVGRAPFEPNHGLIFIPGNDTWHGFVKRPIHGIRRSLIVNYVTDDWRERWQLAG